MASFSIIKIPVAPSSRKIRRLEAKDYQQHSLNGIALLMRRLRRIQTLSGPLPNPRRGTMALWTVMKRLAGPERHNKGEKDEEDHGAGKS